MCKTLPCSEQCNNAVQSGFVTQCAGLKQSIMQCISTHARADQKHSGSTRKSVMTIAIQKTITPIQVSTQAQAIQTNHTPYFVSDAGIGFPLPTTGQQTQHATG